MLLICYVPNITNIWYYVIVLFSELRSRDERIRSYLNIDLNIGDTSSTSNNLVNEFEDGDYAVSQYTFFLIKFIFNINCYWKPDFVKFLDFDWAVELPHWCFSSKNMINVQEYLISVDFTPFLTLLTHKIARKKCT